MCNGQRTAKVFRLDFPVIHKGFAFQMGKTRHEAESLVANVQVGAEVEVLGTGSVSGSGSRLVNFSFVLVTTCVCRLESQHHNKNKNNLT